jgi:hypothetical protein
VPSAPSTNSKRIASDALKAVQIHSAVFLVVSQQSLVLILMFSEDGGSIFLRTTEPTYQTTRCYNPERHNLNVCSVVSFSFFFFSFSGWGETESTWYVGHCWPIVPAPDNRWWWLWSSWWNEDWQGKPKYSERTCPSATLSTTNPTRPDLGWNPGRRGGKPATNRLSYGTAQHLF